MKSSSYLLVIIIGVALVFGGVSLTYASLKMKLLPLIVSGLLLVLAIIELSREILNHQKSAPPKKKALSEDLPCGTMNEGVEFERSDDIRGDMVGFVWLLGMIIITYLFGFLASIPIFMIIYLISRGIGKVKSTLLAVATVISTYIIFVKLLQVELYEGVVIRLFYS